LLRKSVSRRKDTSALAPRFLRLALPRLMEDSRSNLSEELEKFAQNTLRFVQEERSLILDPIEVPDLRTSIYGRHALIVVRGEGFKEDLAIIKSYLQDVRPVLSSRWRRRTRY